MLAGLNSPVREVLELTRLANVMPSYSEEAAFEALGGPRRFGQTGQLSREIDCVKVRLVPIYF